jgi:putative transposase
VIRIYPRKDQKLTLKRWFGAYRWTYNQLVAKSKDRDPATKWTKYNLKTLRGYALNSDSTLLKANEMYSWVLQTPYDVRDGATEEFITALKANFAKKKKNPSFRFDMQFKSKKKHRQESIPILAKHYKKAGVFFPESFGTQPLGMGQEPLPNRLKYDARLIQNKVGHYFMVIPMAPLHIDTPRSAWDFLGLWHVPHHTYFQESDVDLNIASIDPGVRTFATIYDPGSIKNPGGKWIKWGESDISRIYRLCLHADKLQSQIDTPRKQRSRQSTRKGQTSRMRKAFRKIHLTIQNFVKEFHCRCAKWLCENYNLILLPKFETQQMVSTKTSKSRKINSKTVRQMLTWSHYSFQQRLIHKSSQYPNCHVEMMTEEYTSKTCPECGFIHRNLGGNKMFRCPQCKYTCDRDSHGSRNVFLKWMTDQHNKLSELENTRATRVSCVL